MEMRLRDGDMALRGEDGTEGVVEIMRMNNEEIYSTRG